MQVIELAEW